MTGLPWIHSNEAEIFISNKTSFLCPNFAYPLKVTGASGGLLGKICQISQIFSTLLKISCPKLCITIGCPIIIWTGLNIKIGIVLKAYE